MQLPGVDRRFGRRGSLLVWLIGLAAMSFSLWSGVGYLAWERHLARRAVDAEQQRIVAAVYTFQARHGRLPESLQEAGIVPDEEIFGSMSYFRDLSGGFELVCDEYFLVVGFDRIRHWHFDSRSGTWNYWDERI